MTKNELKRILEIADKNPVTLYGDNMILANLNMENGEYLLGDSALWCIKVNVTVGPVATSQTVAPYEMLCFPYDQIQYAKVFPKTSMLKTSLEALKEDAVEPINDEDIDLIIEKILSSTLISSSSPIGTNNQLDFKVDTYGTFSKSVGVTVGRNADPYYEKAMKRDIPPTPAPEPTP